MLDESDLAIIPGAYDWTLRGIGLLEKILKDATAYCEHARRKTAYKTDVVYALKKNGIM